MRPKNLFISIRRLFSSVLPLLQQLQSLFVQSLLPALQVLLLQGLQPAGAAAASSSDKEKEKINLKQMMNQNRYLY